MTKKAWGEIEEMPFRVDVGTSFDIAMSSSVPAHVLCFTTDGRIVLNETVFGGASSIYINGNRYNSSITSGSITLPMAEKGVDGLMYGADKVKLDSIQAGAEVNVVTDISSDEESINITDKDDVVHKAASRLWADTIDTNLSKIQENATALGNLINSNYAELKENVNNLDNRITSEKAYLEQKVNNDVDKLKQADKDLRENFDIRLTEINQQYENIKTDVDMNSAQLALLNDNITKANKKIESHEISITEGNKKIESIQEDLQGVNISLMQISTQIEDLRKQIGQGGGGGTDYSADIKKIYSLLSLVPDEEIEKTHE